MTWYERAVAHKLIYAKVLAAGPASLTATTSQTHRNPPERAGRTEKCPFPFYD